MAKELWEIAKGPGKPPAFNSPQEMWDRAVEYFKWCGQNQIIEEKVGFFQGEPSSAFVGHSRPMTISGLCVFLNVDRQTYYNYKKNPEYFDITKSIDEAMFEQKFAGAATGQFNANIIARDLGLAEKQDITSNGNLLGKEKTDEEFMDQLKKLGVKIDG